MEDRQFTVENEPDGASPAPEAPWLRGKPTYPTPVDGEALDRAVAAAMNDADAGRTTRRQRPSERAVVDAIEATERAVADAMNSVDQVRTDRIKRQKERNVTLSAGLLGLFTGQRTEDPRIIRRAKARDAFYRRALAFVLVAMVCATALGVTWMLTR